jgi:type IV secretory pathway VirB4 component
MKPILEFPYPMELSQFYHPFHASNIVRSLEVTIAKIDSTMELQRRSGDTVSSELRVKLEDTQALLNRIVSGEDKIIEASFYITLSAPDIDLLNQRSQEFEIYLRQIGVKARRAVKESIKAYKCCLPLAYDEILDTYTFDTKSLTTLLPLTTEDYSSNSGIVYGTTHDLSHLIMLNRFMMMNPNMIILGTTGAGKSMFIKTVEIARQILDGAKVLIIDHNGEYKQICDILDGQYMEEGGTPNWNHHLVVFNGNKVKALKKIWTYVTQAKKQRRILVIDEFHNILNEDKDFMLLVMREIRKFYVAPTLSTQNIRGLLLTEEGKMILDLCSIKILMKQGESDLEEVERLFRLSDNEKLFLMTAPTGRGYIYTDVYKSRFRVDYSTEEERLLSTNPMHRR